MRCDNFRMLPAAETDRLLRSLQAVFQPASCTPERVKFSTGTAERAMWACQCQRCGKGFEMPANDGGYRRKYCDDCKRY